VVFAAQAPVGGLYSALHQPSRCAPRPVF
jgi:hypothetical protein